MTLLTITVRKAYIHNQQYQLFKIVSAPLPIQYPDFMTSYYTSPLFQGYLNEFQLRSFTVEMLECAATFKKRISFLRNSVWSDCWLT